MRRIGIKALKNDLSKHIRAVEAGEAVLVTDRGRVVAEIVPPRAPSRDPDEEVFADLVRRGLAQERTTPKGAPLPRRKPVMSHEAFLRDLDEGGAIVDLSGFVGPIGPAP
jgi:prevent-host-death family protein